MAHSLNESSGKSAALKMEDEHQGNGCASLRAESSNLNNQRRHRRGMENVQQHNAVFESMWLCSRVSEHHYY